VRYVEPYVVAVEQTIDDLASPRDDVEDVRRRKRRVMEERDGHIGAQPAQVVRHHPQVVVVHPDYRVLLRNLRGSLREDPVDLEVVLPVRLIELRLVEEGED